MYMLLFFTCIIFRTGDRPPAAARSGEGWRDGGDGGRFLHRHQAPRFGGLEIQRCPPSARPQSHIRPHLRHSFQSTPTTSPPAMTQDNYGCMVKANGNMEKKVLSFEEKYDSTTQENCKLREVLFFKTAV